jgi:hypothetical protein
MGHLHLLSWLCTLKIMGSAMCIPAAAPTEKAIEHNLQTFKLNIYVERMGYCNIEGFKRFVCEKNVYRFENV